MKLLKWFLELFKSKTDTLVDVGRSMKVESMNRWLRRKEKQYQRRIHTYAVWNAHWVMVERRNAARRLSLCKQ